MPIPLVDPKTKSFENAHRSFCWQVPGGFNMAGAVCDRHAGKPSATALLCETSAGQTARYTFRDLRLLSNRLANAFQSSGVQTGDPVAIILPQRVETGLCHLAAWKIGAVSLPLSVLFGTDALQYRLQDSGARIVICSKEGFDRVQSLRAELPDLDTVINCDDPRAGFWPLLNRGADTFETIKSAADDPALIIYTSGTAGPLRGR